MENLLLVFQAFQGTVISTALRSMRFGSFLLLLGGSAEAIGFRAGLQDVSAIGDAIQQSFAQSRVANDLRVKGGVKLDHRGGAKIDRYTG